jgi:hypothetical protein
MTSEPTQPASPGSLRRDRKPEQGAGQDLYQAAEVSFVDAAMTGDRRWLAVEAARPLIRAVVDRVAELVRAEQTAEIERLTAKLHQVAAGRYTWRNKALEQELHADQLTVQLGEADATADAYHADRDRQRARAERAEADLAAMTARAESAEARYDRARPIVQAALAFAGRPLGMDDFDDAYDELRAAVREFDEEGAEIGLSSTETGVQATVEGQDANGPQDGSGGAA